MSLQSNDLKREEFHRYLEKAGVIEYFSQVLVALYEISDKPADPNEYIREQLSIAFPDDTDFLRREIHSLDERLIMKEHYYAEIIEHNYKLVRELEEVYNYKVDPAEVEEILRQQAEEKQKAREAAEAKKKKEEEEKQKAKEAEEAKAKAEADAKYATEQTQNGTQQMSSMSSMSSMGSMTSMGSGPLPSKKK